MLVQDIWFKAQRVLRTVVQVAIPAFLTFNLVLPQVVEAVGGVLPEDAYLWLNGAALGVTAIAGALSRVMAIPQINTWLASFGLGSVPRFAAKNDPADVAPEEESELDFDNGLDD